VISSADLHGRHALVTGGSRGIGWATARALAIAGAGVDVVAASVESLARAEAMARREGLDNIYFRQVDLRDASEIDGILAEVGQVRQVDILINNAGSLVAAAWDEEKPQKVQDMWNLNYHTPRTLMAMFIPAMADRGWGRVINITSIYGNLGAPFVASYAATKAALLSLTRSAALSVAAKGVTVNSLSPGVIETDMTMADPEYAEEVRAKTPVGRLGAPAEIAAVVAFLTTQSFITGADIVVDGGLALTGG
jgi:NAD(P)-dependent dehydrogenase (short-subunit alcohol dehydrogenase family)